MFMNKEYKTIPPIVNEEEYLMNQIDILSQRISYMEKQVQILLETQQSMLKILSGNEK